MKRQLYSELRTLYETTDADPHTFRLTMKLKDLVDGDVLRAAVDAAMERYPYFRVRLYRDGLTVGFEDNPEPVPVLHTNRRITLGGQETSGHLLAFSYWKNRLYMDAYHALTDGGGIAPLIRTLLYYYLTGYYGISLSTEEVRLSGSPVFPEEWEDPAKRPLAGTPAHRTAKWEAPAFQLEGSGLVSPVPDSTVFNVRIPEAEFMRFSISRDGSPATIVSLLLARAVEGLRPKDAPPSVIAMCVNQRRALRAPLAHQSLVGDVRLPYTDRVRALPFTLQATAFRGMVILQSDTDAVLDDIRDYQALVERLEAMDSHEARKDCCRERMEALSRSITATVSYVGKAGLGDMEPYIQEYEALPSTALPSTHVPLTIEMSALHGSFYLNFIQYFPETELFTAFIRQLRENGIDYDVLNVTEALYPRVQLPF